MSRCQMFTKMNKCSFDGKWKNFVMNTCSYKEMTYIMPYEQVFTYIRIVVGFVIKPDLVSLKASNVK